MTAAPLTHRRLVDRRRRRALTLALARSAAGRRAALAAARRPARRSGAIRAAWLRSRRRLDPEAATGLALTLALIVRRRRRACSAVLAYLVRGDDDLVRLDDERGELGRPRTRRRSRPTRSNAVTDLGEPHGRRRAGRGRWRSSRRSGPGAGGSCRSCSSSSPATASLTTTVKDLADRVRPELNPVAETLGPSFPSGHSSWSAAFFAAAALLLGRGRGRRARALLAGDGGRRSP